MSEKFCNCGALMLKIYSQGEFKHFCPVCHPDTLDIYESQKADALDIQQEMRREMDCE